MGLGFGVLGIWGFGVLGFWGLGPGGLCASGDKGTGRRALASGAVALLGFGFRV